MRPAMLKGGFKRICPPFLMKRTRARCRVGFLSAIFLDSKMVMFKCVELVIKKDHCCKHSPIEETSSEKSTKKRFKD